MNRFRGGLVFKAHRRVYHSTLGLRVTKEKDREDAERPRAPARTAPLLLAPTLSAPPPDFDHPYRPRWTSPLPRPVTRPAPRAPQARGGPARSVRCERERERERRERERERERREREVRERQQVTSPSTSTSRPTGLRQQRGQPARSFRCSGAPDRLVCL